MKVVCITSQCFVGDCKDYVRRSQKTISLFSGILLLNPLMPTEWSMLQTLLSISSRHYPLWIGRANLVLRAIWTSRYHHDDTVVLGAGLKLKLNGKFVKSSMLPWFNHYYTQGVIVLGHNLPCYSKVRSKQEFQLIMKSSNKWLGWGPMDGGTSGVISRSRKSTTNAATTYVYGTNTVIWMFWGLSERRSLSHSQQRPKHLFEPPWLRRVTCLASRSSFVMFRTHEWINLI